MPSSSHRPASLGANMTPMIDVVFLMIVFFMLVAQITRQQSVELDLAPIDAERTSEIAETGKIVVNVIPEARAPEMGGAYRIGSLAFDGSDAGVARLATSISSLHAERPDAAVLVRADRAEAYERIEPVLRALREAGVEEAMLVTAPERGAR